MQKNSFSKTYELAATALLVGISIILGQFAFYIPLFGFPSVRISITGIPIFVAGGLFGGVFGAMAGFASDIINFILTAGKGGAFHLGFTLNSILVGLIPGLFFTMVRKGKIKLPFNKINGILALLALAGALYYINYIGIKEVTELKTIFGLPANIILSILMTLIVAGLIYAMHMLQKKFSFKEDVFSLDKLIFVKILSYCIVQLGLTPIWLYQMYNIPIKVSIFIRVFKGVVDVPLQILLVYLVLKAIPVRMKGKIA